MSNKICIFDVKQYYDAAYEEKAKARINVNRFRRLLAKAEQLDATYRDQLVDAPTFSYGSAA